MPTDEHSLFALKMEDSVWIDKLVRAVRLLLTRPTVTPFQIAGIADLLFALERLPASTSGASVSLSVSTRYRGNLASFDMLMESEYFALETVETFYDPRIGGDTESRTVLAVDTSGGRANTDAQAIESWMVRFAALAEDPESDILVEWEGISRIDPYDEPDPELWDRCSSDYV